MKYPIGIQNFRTIREEGFVYVDKTALIYDLVNENKYIFLARPRRFGKSLLLSTIHAYFEGEKELFKGLLIEKFERQWKQYPVFHLKLATVNPDSHDSLKAVIDTQFLDWEQKLGIENQNLDFGSRFSTILKTSYKITGKGAVILVDEYDNPLINSFHDQDIQEKNRNLLKSIYSNFKDQDEYIRYGMLTGVSRFSKMSVFSGVNNLNDISFDDKYSQLCGITSSELKTHLSYGIAEMANYKNLSDNETLKLLKRNYDGYHFSKNCEDIYNPLSLLCALDKKEIGNYWFTTGTPSFLVKRLYDEEVDLKEFLTTEAGEQTLSSSDSNHESILALLYQTGYLTIKGYDTEWQLYQLGIPNLEVRQSLFFEFIEVFQDKKHTDGISRLKKMVSALRSGNAEEFLFQLKSYFASIPYTFTQNNSELYFENNIYILFNLIGIHCEVETTTSESRIDVVIKSDNYIFLLELKKDSSVQKALRQIEEKEYALPYASDSRKIIFAGVNFSSTTRNISDWVIKEYN